MEEGAALKENKPPNLRLVGNYVITDEKIGQGQFGKVYLAQRRELYFATNNNYSLTQDMVACKIISFANKSDKQIDDMEKEALMMRNLDHPNIIRLH